MRPHAAQMSPPPPFQVLVDWGALWASIGPLIGAISLPIDWPIGNQLDLLVLSSILRQCFEQLTDLDQLRGGGRERSASVTMSATYPSPSGLSSDLLPWSNARD
jgi:hypothetical protein